MSLKLSTIFQEKFDRGELFKKVDLNSSVFNLTSASTVSIKSGSEFLINSKKILFNSNTQVQTNDLLPGNDYFVYINENGEPISVIANQSWPNPVSSSAIPLNSILIGGFHYSPSINIGASVNSGGIVSNNINEYSFWDLKWRPSCEDPRGMSLIAGMFWSDIYFLNDNPDQNGTSKNNATIANNSNLPKIPQKFGGNNYLTYSSFNWWNASECLSAFQKRLPTYFEFSSLAFGTKENVSRGNNSITTGIATSNSGSSNLDENFTSKWGIIQSTGCFYTWGNNFGGGALAASFVSNTENRGSTFQLSGVINLGGSYLDTTNSGSRAARFSDFPNGFSSLYSARGVCDHTKLI